MAPQNESMPSKDTTGEPDKNVSGEGQKLKEGLALGATDSSRSSTNASIGELEAMPLKGNAAEVDKITSGGEEEVKEGELSRPLTPLGALLTLQQVTPRPWGF